MTKNLSAVAYCDADILAAGAFLLSRLKANNEPEYNRFMQKISERRKDGFNEKKGLENENRTHQIRNA